MVRAAGSTARVGDGGVRRDDGTAGDDGAENVGRDGRRQDGRDGSSSLLDRQASRTQARTGAGGAWSVRSGRRWVVIVLLRLLAHGSSHGGQQRSPDLGL